MLRRHYRDVQMVSRFLLPSLRARLPHPSASEEMPLEFIAVQPRTSVDNQYPVLPAAMYSVLSWTKKQIRPIERLVYSKIKTKN